MERGDAVTNSIYVSDPQSTSPVVLYRIHFRIQTAFKTHTHTQQQQQQQQQQQR